MVANLLVLVFANAIFICFESLIFNVDPPLVVVSIGLITTLLGVPMIFAAIMGEDNFLHGYINPAIICHHCQTKGKTRIKAITQKSGVSGGKATAAILTGGVSLVATGLSRTEHKTQFRCDNCKVTWTT